MTVLLRDLRLDKGWSQEQLADISGLSVRTVQRLEAGDPCALETAKALAAAFDTRAEIFIQRDSAEITPEDEAQVRRLRLERFARNRFGFYKHALTYVICNTMMMVINLTFTPGYLWFLYSVAFWGVSLAFHGIGAFRPEWEERAIRKMIERDEQSETS